MTDVSNKSEELAVEYLRLGGRRRAVLDDNLVSTRQWENENTAAGKFWREQIQTLPVEQQKDVEKFLPDINSI